MDQVSYVIPRLYGSLICRIFSAPCVQYRCSGILIISSTYCIDFARAGLFIPAAFAGHREMRTRRVRSSSSSSSSSSSGSSSRSSSSSSSSSRSRSSSISSSSSSGSRSSSSSGSRSSSSSSSRSSSRVSSSSSSSQVKKHYVKSDRKVTVEWEVLVEACEQKQGAQ